MILIMSRMLFLFQDFLPMFVDYCTSLGELPTKDSLEALDKMVRCV